jgi:hypothetical protein
LAKLKRPDPQNGDPFLNWDDYDPTPKMRRWRETYERCIRQAMESEGKLGLIRSTLSSDPQHFCKKCEAKKCYGTLYPICEPVLKTLREML